MLSIVYNVQLVSGLQPSTDGVTGGFITVAHKCHGTTYCVTAQLTFSRQNLLSRGTIYFLTVQLTFSLQNYFFIANITFLLVAAQFTFSRHNLLSHGGGQFSRWKCRESGQKNPIPTRPGSLKNRFHFPSWLPTMKM